MTNAHDPSTPDQDTPREKNSVGDYMSVGPMFTYLVNVFRPGHSRGGNFNLRAMHTINKISIAMFLVGLMVLFYKLFIR